MVAGIWRYSLRWKNTNPMVGRRDCSGGHDQLSDLTKNRNVRSIG